MNEAIYFINLVKHIEKQVKFWLKIDFTEAALLYLVQIEVYLEFIDNIISNKIFLYESSKDDYLSSNKFINNNKDLKQNPKFLEYKHHFRQCLEKKCAKCGGNLVNIMLKRIEPIRRIIVKKDEYRNVFNTIKDMAYCNDYESLLKKYSSLKTNDLADYEEYFKNYGLEWEKVKNKTTQHNYIPVMIRHCLEFRIKQNLRELYCNKEIILLIKEDSKEKNRICYSKEDFTKLEGILGGYMKSFLDLRKIFKPFLDLIQRDFILQKEFKINREVFSEYSREISRIGKEGERRIYDVLKSQFLEIDDFDVIWINEKKERGKPYDIKIKKGNSLFKYVEVKTSHSDDSKFYLSKNEYNFARKNSKNYVIYLVKNLGNGDRCSYEIINDFNSLMEKKRLEIISYEMEKY